MSLSVFDLLKIDIDASPFWWADPTRSITVLSPSRAS
jgi:hypothetical protein